MAFFQGLGAFSAAMRGGKAVERIRKPKGIIRSRQPRKMNADNASLTQLSSEVIARVFDIIRDESPKTLPSLALVSSYYHRMTRYAQYAELHLDTAKDIEILEEKLAYIEENNLAPAIRRVKVIQTACSPQAQALLTKLILRADGLTDLEWVLETQPSASSGIPSEVTDMLRRRPNVRLHATFYPHRTPEGFEQAIEASILRLESCANLCALSVAFKYHSHNECIAITRSVKRLLLSCPEIRKFAFDVGPPTAGCTMYAFPPSYVGLGFVDGERPPAFEELELYSYDFGNDKPHNRAGWSENLIPYPGKGCEMTYWAETFDWSRLRCLKTDNMTFASHLTSAMTSLEEVSVTGNVDSVQLRNFYEQLPVALKSLTVPSIAVVGLETVLKHGSRLRNLTLHQNESNYSDSAINEWASAAADIEMLLKIREHCPYIENLSLDVRRDGEWPYQVLKTLAGFPRLQNLTIWFQLGSEQTDRITKPFVTFAAAGDLVQYVHQQRRKDHRPIEQLQIFSGCPFPLGRGYPSRTALWPHENSISFTCKLSERDDEMARGVYTVYCPALSKEANDMLRASDFSGCSIYDAHRIRCAHDGPTPMVNN